MATTNTPSNVTPAPMTVTDEEISEASAQLATTEQEIAKRYGFTADDGELFFAKGTKLYDSGILAANQYAREYKAMPATADAAVTLGKTIAGEQRRDRVITPSEWYLDTAGMFKPRAALTVEGKSGPITVEPDAVAVSLNATAWSQLGQKQAALVPSLPRFPTDEDYAARAAVPADILKAWNEPRGNLNAWLPKATGENKARVRNVPGATGRQMFACVSKRYTDYDGDAVLRDIAKAMPGTKCDLRYNPETTETRARVLIQAPIDVPAFIGVGRVHQAGIEFRTRDDGMASLSGRGFLVRVRCKNHSLVTENATKIKRRHTGEQSGLVEQVQNLLGTIPGMIAELSELWGKAAAHHYLDTDGTPLSVEEALTRLVFHGHIPSGGLNVEGAVANYMAAWKAEESPTSAAGVLMAVQRAAHEETWRTKWAVDEIEESASAALYQSVYVLAAPADRAPLEMS